MKKFLAIFVVALLAFVGCDKNKEKSVAGSTDIDGQWHLVEWNGEAPEFEVYVEYKAGEFDIYQQVYSLYYEHFEGDYVINGDVVTGSYNGGSKWACGYKYEVSGNQLVMYSQENTSVKSVYEKCEIPQTIVDEATTTRSSEVNPWL